MSFDTGLRALMVVARDAVTGIASQTTVRGGRIVESLDGSSLIDIVWEVASEKGNRRSRATAELNLEVFSAGHSQSCEISKNIAENNLQVALDELYASDEIATYLNGGIVYERGEIEGGDKGSFSWGVVARITTESFTIDASPQGTVGIAASVVGIHPFGNATITDTDKLTEIELLTPQNAPADVTAWYVNALFGDDVELIDAADAIVSTFSVVIAGNGLATFNNIAAGVYRSRIAGNISHLTARVVDAPETTPP